MGIENIYKKFPVFLQHAAVSFQGMRFRTRRANGRVINKELSKLLDSQHWTSKEFKDFQLREVKRLIINSIDRVPWYRDRFLDYREHISQMKSITEIRVLPILEKVHVKGNEDEFLNIDYRRDSLYKGNTSGTTGTPMNWFESRDSFSKRQAFIARLRVWAGVEQAIYPRRIQFTGRDIFESSVQGRKVYRYNISGNSLLMSTTHLSEESVAEYLDAIRKFKPSLMDGYPSAMLILARLALAKQLQLPKIPAIISTAETLSKGDAEFLANAFDARVFDQFSSSEATCFWSSCEFGNLHINPEYGITEIVKPGTDIPVAAGEVGEVVTTAFTNPVMPLIRYRLGDLAILDASADCPCGRHMPRIQQVIGRQDDVLFIPGRGYLGRLDPVFKGLSHIVEAQIRQVSLNSLQILLVPDTYSSKNDLQTAVTTLLDNLQDKVGTECDIQFLFVESIPRGANGKFRAVVSEVRHQYPTQF